jgi:hypothetical protein
VGFDVTDQLLIRFSAFVRYWRNNWEYEILHQLFINFKKAYVSMTRELLYNILIELGYPRLIRLIRLIKMCLNETCSKVRIGKHLSENFPIQNGVK